MTVHHIKIKNDMFDPRTLTVKLGDQINFKLDGRAESATVRVSQGQLFDGENEFVVGRDGKDKTISRSTSPQTYKFSTTPAIPENEKVPREQTGTVNGTIIVIP